METASILIIFMSSLLVGITGYSVFTSFGPASQVLRDPFEEHED
jgi:PsbN protein|tara:strand:- start:411 stop:542 length:132 start_codon:yes stop_codon:yes gene_type:complete